MKLDILDKARILTAAEVNMLPFRNREQAEIDVIRFLPIAELLSFLTHDKPLLLPSGRHTLPESPGLVIEARDPNWNGWMKRIHADDTKQTTQVDFLPTVMYGLLRKQ